MKVKRRLTATLAAVTAVALGVGIWHFTPDVKPSAEADEITSVQKIVGALPQSEYMGIEYEEIAISVGNDIDGNIADTQENNVRSPYQGTVSVADRDWTIYDDEYGVSKMSSSEQAFYRRLEDAGVKYITDSTLDAQYMTTYDLYVTEGIPYNDLGLSNAQAIGLTQWFIYNNPQYYFYRTRFLISDVSVYMGCYDEMADGDDRANITNQIFSVIDGWVESINDDEVTTYQKVKSAHDLLCNELDYKTGPYDQSIYSTVMQGETVCAGYSGAMSMMLNASGIPSTVGISSTHAWNLVLMDDGIYYGVDVTWDDTLNGNMLFAVGKTDLARYDGKTTEHIYVYPWTEFAPTISSKNYSPSYYDINGSEVPAPYDFKHIISGTTATVTWSANDADGYVVKNGNSQTIVNKATTNVTVKAGASVTINVAAYKKVSGKTYYSEYVPYTITAPAAPATKLDKPTIIVTEVSEGNFRMSWDAVQNATAYEYRLSSNPDFSTSAGQSTNYTGRSLTLNNLKEGRTYYLRVRAKATINGETIYSEYDVATISRPVKTSETTTPPPTTTTPPATTTAPETTTKPETTTTKPSVNSIAAPTGLTVKKQTSAISKFSWSKVSGATKYEYVVAKDANFTNVISSGTSLTTSQNITGMKGVTKAYIKIRTIVGSGSNVQYSDWTIAEFTIN